MEATPVLAERGRGSDRVMSPRLEVVEITRVLPLNKIKISPQLRSDHPERTPVFSGTERVAWQLRNGSDAVALWPWPLGEKEGLLAAEFPTNPKERRKLVVARNHHSDDFGGTSSATALSAGIAALVLSARPDLTWVEAREILRTTAVKIDRDDESWLDASGCPSNRPDGGLPFWSPLFGFGRLDSAAAVARALAYDARPDLMIRGALDDDGTAPTMPDADSPDLWVRRLPPKEDPGAVLTDSFAPAPHQHPIPGGKDDHWIYARVRNRGPVDSLEAWVRFSVTAALNRPFEHPKDWKPRNGTGNRSRLKWQSGTYWIGEVGLPRLSAGADFVVHLRWPAALLPPWQQFYLLVEITPHDGPLSGSRVHKNNNLAQRAIFVEPGLRPL